MSERKCYRQKENVEEITGKHPSEFCAKVGSEFAGAKRWSGHHLENVNLRWPKRMDG